MHTGMSGRYAGTICTWGVHTSLFSTCRYIYVYTRTMGCMVPDKVTAGCKSHLMSCHWIFYNPCFATQTCLSNLMSRNYFFPSKILVLYWCFTNSKAGQVTFDVMPLSILQPLLCNTDLPPWIQYILSKIWCISYICINPRIKSSHRSHPSQVQIMQIICIGCKSWWGKLSNLVPKLLICWLLVHRPSAQKQPGGTVR